MANTRKTNKTKDSAQLELELKVNVEMLPISKEAKEQLPEFLKIVDGPNSLQCLVSVARTYLKIQNLNCFTSLPYELEGFSGLLNELVTKNDDIRKINPIAAYNTAEVFRNSARYTIKGHPLYSVLIFCYDTREPVFTCLQKAFLLGSYLAKQRNLDLKDSDKYYFNLFMRKLTLCNLGRNWLENTDTQDLNSFSDLRFELLELDKESKKLEAMSSGDGGDVLPYRGLLLDVLCDIPVIRRLRGPTVKKATALRKSFGIRGLEYFGSGLSLHRLAYGDVDDESESSEIYSLISENIDDELRLDFQEFDIEPAEMEPKVEVAYSEAYAITTAAQNYQNKLGARGKVNAIESQNQQLYGSSQLLMADDLCELFRIIQIDSHLNEEKLLRAIFLAIFATCRHIEQVMNLKVIRSADRLKQEFSDGAIFYDIDSKSWLITSLDLEFKNPVIDGVNECAIETGHPYVELPDMFRFEEALRKACEGAAPFKPFKRIQNCTRKIKKLIKGSESRLTLARVQRFLLLRCAGEYEAVIASLVFSHAMPTASARKFYTVIFLKEVHDIYISLAEPVLTLLNMEPAHVCEQNIKAAVGARYLPTLEHVREAVYKMVQKINLIRKQKRVDWWVEHHNLFTVYCIFVQGLLTGYRGVSQPLLLTEDFIFLNRVAVFSDKGTADHFHERITPCHDLVFSISKEYEIHCQRVKKRLPANVNKDEFTVFFIDPDLSMVEARPKNISEKLKPYTDLPLNSNRKLLRRFLAQCGCSPIAIDTLLGHGARGEKFWGTFSSRPLSSIIDELLEHISSLVQELEIGLVKGLQR